MENHHAINGKIHYKWPFPIAMLNYQRVSCLVIMIMMPGGGFKNGGICLKAILSSNLFRTFPWHIFSTIVHRTVEYRGYIDIIHMYHNVSMSAHRNHIMIRVLTWCLWPSTRFTRLIQSIWNLGYFYLAPVKWIVRRCNFRYVQCL